MRSSRRSSALAHGWRLFVGEGIPEALVSKFIRPAVRSIPPAMARQVGACRVSVVQNLGAAAVDSRWTLTDQGLEISVASADREHHNIALEVLLCVGQSLWNRLSDAQRREYWLLLDAEIGAGIRGEIDEDALEQKRRLMSSRISGGSSRRLEGYGSASFAGTAAEYVHSLWHDVTVRSGPDFLPAEQLKRRLELMLRWYSPAHGRQLFPAGSNDGESARGR